MTRLLSRGTGWLIDPCLIPVLVALGPALREALSPRFKAVVDEVHVARVWIPQQNEYEDRYHVTVFINHRGPRPQWCGKEGRISKAVSPDETYVFDPGLNMHDLIKLGSISSRGEVYRSSSSGSFNLYDPTSERYLIQLHIDISKQFKVEGSRFVAQVKMGSETFKVDSIVKVLPPLRHR